MERTDAQKRHDNRVTADYLLGLPRCDSCASSTVQGVYIHEAGCPNQHKEWNANEGRWMTPEAEAMTCDTCPHEVNSFGCIQGCPIEDE